MVFSYEILVDSYGNSNRPHMGWRKLFATMEVRLAIIDLTNYFKSHGKN
jgi:hypothetical protein